MIKISDQDIVFMVLFCFLLYTVLHCLFCLIPSLLLVHTTLSTSPCLYPSTPNHSLLLSILLTSLSPLSPLTEELKRK